MTGIFKAALLFSGFVIFAKATAGQEVLTLDEAVALTMQSNFDIRMARTAADIETENNTLGNAGFLPTVDAEFLQEFDLNEVRQEFVSGDIREGTGLQNERMNFAVLMDWTVFGGFAAVTNSKRLDIFEKQGEIETRLQVESTLMELFSVYYEAVSLKKQISALESAIEVSSQQLSFAEERKTLGSGSGLEVLQARVDMNTDSAALVRQQFELRRVKSVINELMGRAPDTEFE
ncbi:MAG: TolC family protein, partial [Flavobacteriales bacterium]|nr:TolC family protein [Flavobacteriales bacterium]